jgi:acyl-CoA reductase-like NAD-dependent aldehyde dehydrogenase
MTRLHVTKTYKLFIDGRFPRSESGRTVPLVGRAGQVLAHACRASRKDLRDAVAAARRAQEGWAAASAYLRGQVLYRMAEMLEGRRDEFAALLADAAGVRSVGATGQRPAPPPRRATGPKRLPSPDAEVSAAIDRLVAFAGWADKYAQVLGCNNPVSGPYYNFTVPEPTGVVAVVAPDAPALLGLVSLLAPPLCAGNAVVALAGDPPSSPAAALAAVVLAEVIATSDVPPGVVNILTGLREELVPFIASHRDIDAILAARGPGLSPAHAGTLREGAAENVKRVTLREVTDWFDDDAMNSPWLIEPFVEMKTIWHPSAT